MEGRFERYRRSAMTTPLLTVVIPTAARPHYLPRAVQSAFHASPSDDVEVIVVPNGLDQTWRESLRPFAADRRLRISPVDRANANVARNHGLSLARGKYVRFLDDDDALAVDGARLQVMQLEARGGELCSGAVMVVDEADVAIREMQVHAAFDLFCSMARPGRVCLPTAHLFRHDAIRSRTWDEGLQVEQDTDWMFRLASMKEWDWVVTDQVVGRWTQHGGPRVSDGISNAARGASTCAMLLKAVDVLESRHALTLVRRQAAAEGLWENIHPHFYRAPGQWTRAARRAQALWPAARPSDPLFRAPIARHIDPVLVEWAMIPKRWANRGMRAMFPGQAESAGPASSARRGKG